MPHLAFISNILRGMRNAVVNPTTVPQIDILPEPSHPLRAGPGGFPRSVLFLHNSYYHFFYLAKALRRRGWDAVSVSVEDPENSNSFFYHGEDVNLFDASKDIFKLNLDRAFQEVLSRFHMVQFSGDGQMSFYPWGFDATPSRNTIPFDFMELKKAGIKIGYSSGGCADGISQSAFRTWSNDMCSKCPLEDKVEFCSDFRNLAWGHKREMFCDINFAEALPALDYQAGQTTFRRMSGGPTLLSPTIW